MVYINEQDITYSVVIYLKCYIILYYMMFHIIYLGTYIIILQKKNIGTYIIILQEKNTSQNARALIMPKGTKKKKK